MDTDEEEQKLAQRRGARGEEIQMQCFSACPAPLRETFSAIDVATRRRTDLRTLVRTLRGDLDWIVMKCLEKDRTRRYETANGLAMEIRRFLSDEPVLAGPPSLRYRASKFVTRNRGAVTAAGLVGTALVLGIMGTSIGLVRTERQRRSAEAARAAQLSQTQAAISALHQVSAALARCWDEDIQARTGIKVGIGRHARDDLKDRNWDATWYEQGGFGDLEYRISSNRPAEKVVQSLGEFAVGGIQQIGQRWFSETQAHMAAERSRRDALAMAEFLCDALAAPAPSHGREISGFRDLLDAVSSRLGAGPLEGRPEAELELRLALSKAYGNIGAIDAANDVLEPVGALTRSVLRECNDLVSRARFSGEHCIVSYLPRLGQLLLKAGEYHCATEVLRKCFETARAMHPAMNWQTANIGSMLGEAIGAEALLKRRPAAASRAVTTNVPSDLPKAAANRLGLIATNNAIVEAEQLPTSGFDELAMEAESRPSALFIRHRSFDAGQRLVRFYEDWHAAEPGKGFDAKAAEWRKKLAVYQASTQPAASHAASRPANVGRVAAEAAESRENATGNR